MTPTFATVRLVIRPMRQDDAEALHAAYSDPEANTWSSGPAHTTIAETEARVARSLGAPDWRAWAITAAGDDRAIGFLGAHAKRTGKVAEIAYQLVRAHWGQGLAREAVAALIDGLFAEGYRRISADVDPDNVASNRLLEALGFTLEGRLRDEWETDIGVRDSLIWGLLARDPRGRR